MYRCTVSACTRRPSYTLSVGRLCPFPVPYVHLENSTDKFARSIYRYSPTDNPSIQPLICTVDLYWQSDGTIVRNVQGVKPKFSGIKLHIIIARLIQKNIIIISLLYRFSVTKFAVLVINVSYESPGFHHGRVHVSLWWKKCY